MVVEQLQDAAAALLAIEGTRSEPNSRSNCAKDRRMLRVKRYELGAIVLTSNLPFTQWASAFADDQTDVGYLIAIEAGDRFRSMSARVASARWSRVVWHRHDCAVKWRAALGRAFCAVSRR